MSPPFAEPCGREGPTPASGAVGRAAVASPTSKGGEGPAQRSSSRRVCLIDFAAEVRDAQRAMREVETETARMGRELRDAVDRWGTALVESLGRGGAE